MTIYVIQSNPDGEIISVLTHDDNHINLNALFKEFERTSKKPVSHWGKPFDAWLLMWANKYQTEQEIHHIFAEWLVDEQGFVKLDWDCLWVP